MKKREWLILAIVFVLLLLFCFLYYHGRKAGNTAVIAVDGKTYATVSLNEDQEVEVKQDGRVTNVVAVKDGVVFMKEADCPNQLCVMEGKKAAAGASIVCLPNKVTVTIEGEDGYDAFTN